jgi:hypothetical protein
MAAHRESSSRPRMATEVIRPHDSAEVRLNGKEAPTQQGVKQDKRWSDQTSCNNGDKEATEAAKDTHFTTARQQKCTRKQRCKPPNYTSSRAGPKRHKSGWAGAPQ